MVQGAVEHDEVRLHGAIDAALQVYPQRAGPDIFFPALLEATRRHGGACGDRISEAIRGHRPRRF
jgi:hypothetical protein